MDKKRQDFLHAKMRINEAKKAKSDRSKFDKSIDLAKYQGKRFLDFSLIKNGIKNNYQVEEEKLLKLKQKINLLKAEEKNKHKFNKNQKNNKNKAINFALEKLLKEYKKQKEKTYKENLLLKKEIKEINILNNKPKGKVSLKNTSDDEITVKNVSKLYSSKSMIFKGLDDVSLSIKKGTFNVILGPSGSGKTTLLNMISGLDRCTMGEVIIGDINIQALSEKQTTLFRREKLGFVFQSYNLLSSLNVVDNIEVGRSLQNDANKRMDLDRLLDDMDMSYNKKKMTYELSGGQQQRVSIARALSKTPSILIGDEPTGSLDQESSRKVYELFQKINKKNDTTVIIVTHNPNVAKLANMVIKIKDGKIDKIIHNEKPLKVKNLKEV